jgi:hypothetical protein
MSVTTAAGSGGMGSKYLFAGGVGISQAVLPTEWPMYLIIAVGLLAGSALNYGLAKASNKQIAGNWLLLQALFYPGALVFLLWLQESAGLSVKSTGMSAVVAALLSYDGVSAWRNLRLRQLEGLASKEDSQP